MSKRQTGVREADLVRAELMDALEDYADLFRDSAVMELERASAVTATLQGIRKGHTFRESDTPLEVLASFCKRYQVLNLRLEEKGLQIQRLLAELGE